MNQHKCGKVPAGFELISSGHSFSYLTWKLVLVRFGTTELLALVVTFCPWCGEKLPIDDTKRSA